MVGADGADILSAGAHGDGTALLAEVLAHDADLDIPLIVGDPAAVRQAADLVQAKSAKGFRAHSCPIAAAIVRLHTLGPCDI